MTLNARPASIHSLRRLLGRAAALAALAFLAAAPAAHAEVILGLSCTYGFPNGDFIANQNDVGCEPGEGGEGSETNTFGWEDYSFELTLFNVSGFGDITIIDHAISEEEFQSKFGFPEEDFSVLNALGAYVCIPLVDPSTTDQPCRAFEIHADGDLDWSNYRFAIDWNWESPQSDKGINGRARVLRDIDDDGLYDEDMCLQAEQGLPNYVPCEYEPNPIIISGDTDFSTITPALAVPEPAALSLMGTSLLALWYRRRRRC
jgi:hypothetical protein